MATLFGMMTTDHPEMIAPGVDTVDDTNLRDPKCFIATSDSGVVL